MSSLRGVDGLPPVLDAWPQLEVLDLSDNEFSDWSELLPLAGFKSLRWLILNKNKLESISIPGGGAFGEVTLLAAANNNIAGTP
ncbi:hypothetical protein T484DRAFT_1776791 [Baffinella frigidus]|nr:hypothetical protein T484DRAFT_1776791 [Cryptophyta sp. CCMP2293]